MLLIKALECEVFLKDGLEVRLRDRSGTFVMVLVLGPSKGNCAMEKCGGKEDTIYSYGT